MIGKVNARDPFIWSATALFAVAGICVFLILRGQWFFNDEFAFLDLSVYSTHSTNPIAELLSPHNGQPLILAKLWSQLYLHTVGMQYYWLFGIPVTLCYLGVGALGGAIAGTWLHNRWAGLTTSALLLACGCGIQNLTMATQFQFLLPVLILFGWLLAVGRSVRSEGARWWSALVITSVAGGLSSLVFLPLALTISAVFLIRLRKLWSAVVMSAIPIAVWLLTLAIGQQSPLSSDGESAGFTTAIKTVLTGLAQPFVSTTGSQILGVAITLFGFCGLIYTIARKDWRSPVLPLWFAAIMFLTFVSLGRAGFGASIAKAGRYQGVVYALLTIAIAITAVEVLRVARAKLSIKRGVIYSVAVIGAALGVVGGIVAGLDRLGPIRDESAVTQETILAGAYQLNSQVIGPAPTLIEPNHAPNLTTARLAELVAEGRVPIVSQAQWALTQSHVNASVLLTPTSAASGACKALASKQSVRSGQQFQFSSAATVAFVGNGVSATLVEPGFKFAKGATVDLKLVQPRTPAITAMAKGQGSLCGS